VQAACGPLPCILLWLQAAQVQAQLAAREQELAAASAGPQGTRGTAGAAGLDAAELAGRVRGFLDHAAAGLEGAEVSL
jgi:hypothetical protein